MGIGLGGTTTARCVVAITTAWLLAAVVGSSDVGVTAESRPSTESEFLAQGVAYHLDQQDLHQAKRMYEAALALNPSSVEALHLLGACAYHAGDFLETKTYLERAIAAAAPASDAVTMTYCNLAETHRKLLDPAAGLPLAEICWERSSASAFSLAVLGWIHKDLGNYDVAAKYLVQLGQIDADNVEAWDLLGNVYLDAAKAMEAEAAFARVVGLAPDDIRGHAGRGKALQLAGDLDGALVELEAAFDMNPSDRTTFHHLGILFQQMGRLEDAVAIYKQLLVDAPDDMALLNNLGAALLYTGHADDAVAFLEAAIRLNPTLPHGYVNLKTYYADEGNLAMARTLLEQAYNVSHADVLRIDLATLLPQVYTSHDHLVQTRRDLEASLDTLLEEPLTVDNPEEFEIRPPFLLVYQGMNDRAILTTLARIHARACPSLLFTAPHVHAGLGSLAAFDATPRRLRIGFMSKFFVDNHAHGLLLRGVLAHLDRNVFDVTLLVVPDPQQSVDPAMAAAVDDVHVLSMHLFHIQHDIAALQLDVLVFADIMSEPINYYAAFARLAHVQAAFWGNPTTSGIPSIDYFISADAMESSPDPMIEVHYSEQVVLLSGTGIWYDKPEVPPPHELNQRSAYGLNATWTIYMCAQSVYKLLPAFDAIVRDVLARDSAGHVVFLEARHASWTEQFQRRLFAALPPEVHHRVHFTPRAGGSLAYLKLLSVADVVLHPFPFGGSKTSADALLLGLPMVAMKTPFLRSRMAYSFYKHMQVLECVATTDAEYVDIAVRLGTDRSFHDEMARRIRASQESIWENREVVAEWERFLYNAVRSQAS
ncbi:Aste57867_11675 [Aphanomyces stellatus]|uniref:protein O-GlcNAc transferase n=1 Tax=Aphanomyces stellatus TaxID=120398 RepID=A0A485KTM2_9STRA|nr:hypothetical protein As57867_011632 [Aphanomyces stellatus]VFT88533.1 Aste57867_11675 [Aphanomyces stellatus]